MGFEGSVPCCIFRFIVNYGFSTDNFEKIFFTVWFCKVFAKTEISCFEFFTFRTQRNIRRWNHATFVLLVCDRIRKCSNEQRCKINNSCAPSSPKNQSTGYGGPDGPVSLEVLGDPGGPGGRVNREVQEVLEEIWEVHHVHEEHRVKTKRPLITKQQQKQQQQTFQIPGSSLLRKKIVF